MSCNQSVDGGKFITPLQAAFSCPVRVAAVASWVFVAGILGRCA